MPVGTDKTITIPHTGDEATERAFDVVADALRNTQSDVERGRKWLTGVREAGITFVAATAQNVAHGLGRPHRGWRVERDFGAAVNALLETPLLKTDPLYRTHIRLTSATACTVYLSVV